MDYREFPPPASLGWLVRCFWTLSAPAGSREAEPALPDGSPELIVNLGDPFAASRGRGIEPQPSLMLVGQITRPFAVAATGRVSLVAARLQSFGGVVLLKPMQAITDGWIDLSGSAGGARLANVLEARDPDVALPLLIKSLEDLAREVRPPDHRVRHAVERIDASAGMVEVSILAREAATSVRNLQRLFAAEVGVTPKTLCRMRRFQRVFAAWRDDPGSWASVAAECGYFDQAHLVRDFTELAGAAPAGLVASWSAFTRQFTALRESATAS